MEVGWWGYHEFVRKGREARQQTKKLLVVALVFRLLTYVCRLFVAADTIVVS